MQNHRICGALVACGAVLWAVHAQALDIEGVLPGSVDIPHINAAISLPSDPTSPLTAGDPGFETFNIVAFYDTGASGVLISQETAEALGVPLQAGAVFEDVGVGGSEFFNVSDEILVHLAPYIYSFGGGADIDNPATFTTTYNQVFGPLYAQVAQQPAEILPLDVFGMPLFVDKFVTIDPTRFNSGELEPAEVNVYNANNVPTGLPAADLHIQTSYGDFSRFTQTTGGNAPTLVPNPFVGDDPTSGLSGGGGGGSAPGITVSFNGNQSTGNWLFDTGAQASIISEQQALTLGVSYDPNADPENPVLLGAPLADQFQLEIGGVGGSSIVAGFYLDTLILPTVEGEPLVYHRAPVLVADITVQDPDTLEMLTLDGVLGMNFFLPSFDPDGFEIVAGPYNFITFDHTTGLIGLTFNPDVVPTPTSGVMLMVGAVALLRRRR